MKYPIQLLLIFSLWSLAFLPASSQTSRYGYLITVEGDSVAGTIQLVMWEKNPNRINHFLVMAPGAANKKWEAKEILRYALGRGTEVDHFYAKVWPHNGQRVFLKPQMEGKAQLFVVPDPLTLIDRKVGANQLVFVDGYQEDRADAYYVSKIDTELAIRVEKENYDLVLKQMLRDCPELTDKIGQRKFRFNNLERIIGTYNEDCN